MGATTSISWCHHTFNPWWGCEKVSPGCAHCYAESFAKRVGKKVWGEFSPRRFFGDKHWAEPLKWNAAALKAGERCRVFCASMADVFEGRPDLVLPRKRLWKLIEATPQLDWLLLTKRPENIIDFVPTEWLDLPQANVWYGATTEDQASFDSRVAPLLDVPAVVHFVSYEPALGPLDLGDVDLEFNDDGSDRHHRLNWLICGGESGGKARSFEPAWARDIQRQCRERGVAFFMKQMGSHVLVPRKTAVTASFAFGDVPLSPLGLARVRLKASKGDAPTEWPADLREQCFPSPASTGAR